jgi:hypothetical protein
VLAWLFRSGFKMHFPILFDETHHFPASWKIVLNANPFKMEPTVNRQLMSPKINIYFLERRHGCMH